MEHFRYWSNNKVVEFMGTLLNTWRKVDIFCQMLACSALFSLLKFSRWFLARAADKPSMVFMSQKATSIRMK